MEFAAYAQAQRPALLRLAVLLAGDPDLAQDLVQDVLLKAQTEWHRIGEVDHPHAYVRRMLANRAVSWRRKWGRVEPRADAGGDLAEPDQTDAIERRTALLHAIARLPSRQRAVVVLRFYEDLSFDEIGETLGCSAVSARGYLHRALITLRVDGAALASAR